MIYTCIFMYHTYIYMYIWNLIHDTNELIYETETNTDIKNRLVVTKGKESWGGMDQ